MIRSLKNTGILSFLMTLAVFSQDKLSDFRWKNRVLIIPSADQAFIAQLAAEKPRLEERDMIVIVLRTDEPNPHSAKPELLEEIRHRFSQEPENTEFHLIGKDGTTTLNWSAKDFTFAKVYAAIDAMPMRQREMER